MKSKWKRILTAMLSAVMLSGILGGLTFTSAAEADGSWQVGDNATFTLYKDGTGVISGTGKTYDYADVYGLCSAGESDIYVSQQSPLRLAECMQSWTTSKKDMINPHGEVVGYYDVITNVVMRDGEVLGELDAAGQSQEILGYSKEGRVRLPVTSIVVEDGITYLGSCLFMMMSDLDNVTIPASVTGIGNAAFWNGYDGGPKDGPIECTITGVKGSYAEQYAAEKRIPFIDINMPAGIWHQDAYGWWYERGDGTYPANAWEFINDSWYHFNGLGYMQTGWIYDGAWYYLKPDGTMATNWIYDGGNWYYLNSSGDMYTGFLMNNDTCYYLKPDGTMAVGWFRDDYFMGGGWFYADAYGVVQHGWIYDNGFWYHLNEYGKMDTGWVNDGGVWYYLNPGGTMATGWINDTGAWYYLNSNGTMATGWVFDGGSWYYMNAAGIMQTGWVEVDGVSYYFNEYGVWVA